MSRIGKKPVVIPAGVTVTVDDNNVVTVTGPKGTLTEKFNKILTIKVEGNEVLVSRSDDEIVSRSLHGTTRANIHNMVVGVSEGFKKELEIVGIGYRAAMRGTDLVLNLGFSHEVVVKPLPGVKITTPDALKVVVEGFDKQAVGQQAAVIRSWREPEPYKGKGIKYKGETIIRKEGKRAGKK
jgi:large subunit ribosomal protein L6